MGISSSVIEWVALIVGTTGTVIWSLGKNQLIVSVCWLVSSLLWIWFAILNGHDGLTMRDSIGVIMYLIGIRTYLKKTKTELGKD